MLSSVAVVIEGPPCSVCPLRRGRYATRDPVSIQRRAPDHSSWSGALSGDGSGLGLGLLLGGRSGLRRGGSGGRLGLLLLDRSLFDDLLDHGGLGRLLGLGV